MISSRKRKSTKQSSQDLKKRDLRYVLRYNNGCFSDNTAIQGVYHAPDGSPLFRRGCQIRGQFNGRCHPPNLLLWQRD